MANDSNLITGWVKSNGIIEAVNFNQASGNTETNELYFFLEADDHDHPAFTIIADGQTLVMCTRHSRKDLFINRFNNSAKKFCFSEHFV